MTIQDLIKEVEKEMRHLSDSDPTGHYCTNIETIFKCLYAIILIFLTYLEQFGNKFTLFKQILQNILNMLLMLKSSENQRAGQKSQELETVHVNRYTVEEHDYKRPVKNHPNDRELEEAFVEALKETQQLRQELKHKEEELTLKKAEIAHKNIELELKEQKNTKLKEELIDLKLNLNSKTSHIPSSNELGYLSGMPTYRNGQKKEYENEPPKGVGGQPGHPGYQAQVRAGLKADRTIYLYPQGTTSDEIKEGQWIETAVHDYVDIKNQTIITRYVQMGRYIKGKRGPKLIKGKFPPDVWASFTYGLNLRREVFLLYSIGLVSMANMASLMSDNYGLTMSPSTVDNIIKDCSRNFEAARELIIQEIKKQARDKDNIFHMDETSCNVNGDIFWDHILISPDYVLHTINESRGYAGARLTGIFDMIVGTVISDMFNLYLNKQFDNSFCWAHVERDLYASSIREPELEWVKLMMDFARDSYRAWKVAHDQHKPISRERLDRLIAQYNKAVEVGLNEKGPQSTKTSALLLRFANLKDGLLAHLFNPELERTNNAAEKKARSIKRKIDVSNMFKTKKGAENYAALISVIDTAKLQGLNPIETIDQIIGGNIEYIVTHKKNDSLGKSLSKIIEVKKFEKNYRG